MKHSNIYSALIGSTFFAIPYLALSTPFLPSLLIGGAAFCAGELVLKQNKQYNSNNTKDFSNMIKKAKEENKHILDMIPEMEDENVRIYLNKIHSNAGKIIKTIEKKHVRAKGTQNFFTYYLPVVVKIIDRYDEIENQKLSSKESKKFFASTEKMLEEANRAFEKILNNLYQNEIIDTSAEMKVLNSMLKSDGLGTDAFDIVKENENEE